MNPLWGHAIGVMIVIIMLTFIGIWIWAWRSKHKPVFDQMAHIPMQDAVNSDDNSSTSTPNPSEEKSS
jgi:cytochrome c oxidase cbb3-type subunit 4